MEENVYLDKLERRDIKPTAIRLLILKNMLEVGRFRARYPRRNGRAARQRLRP